MSDDDLPNDDQPQYPTILLQFHDPNGLPIEATPADVVSILVPILQQIAKENKVGVGVSYGFMTADDFKTQGDALEASGESE